MTDQRQPEINVFELPSVPLTWRFQLPDCAGVYFAVAGKEILYIGKSIMRYGYV